jgi:hypothetical protein
MRREKEAFTMTFFHTESEMNAIQLSFRRMLCFSVNAIYPAIIAMITLAALATYVGLGHIDCATSPHNHATPIPLASVLTTKMGKMQIQHGIKYK